ncbi:MAG TPA: hypothetical protein VF009_04725 [Solirubrobacterales bacterium]
MNGARQRATWQGSAAVGLLICIAGAALLIKGLYPTDLPSAKDPAFIDIIFHNRAVIWAARLLLVSAAAVLAFGGFFIVISIVVRMRNEEWLRRAGPFEVSETALSEIEGEADFWLNAALDEQEEVVELAERLEEANELIKRFRTAFASGSMVRKEHP